MDPGSTDIAPLVGLLLRLGWWGWLTGPFLVEPVWSFDGELISLRCRSSIVDLTLQDVSLILPEELAWLSTTVSLDQYIGGSLDD